MNLCRCLRVRALQQLARGASSLEDVILMLHAEEIFVYENGTNQAKSVAFSVQRLDI